MSWDPIAFVQLGRESRSPHRMKECVHATR